MGIPYDSDSGRAIAAAITAILTGTSYATSAEMAAELGPFPGYAKNREAMLRVIRNHRRAAHGERDEYEALAVAPVPLDAAASPDRALAEAAAAGADGPPSPGEKRRFPTPRTPVIGPTRALR